MGHYFVRQLSVVISYVLVYNLHLARLACHPQEQRLGAGRDKYSCQEK